MKLRDIVKAGILTVGIGAFGVGAGEVNADPIYSWQIERKPNEILFHVKKGDTISGIVKRLDRMYGNGNPNDAENYLDDVICANGNPFPDQNLIKPGDILSIRGDALNAIYDKNIQIITDSKTNENKITENIPEVKNKTFQFNIPKNKIKTSKEKVGFYLDGNYGYIIPKGVRESFGSSDVWEINGGLNLDALCIGLGYRNWDVDGNSYWRERCSFFGWLYEGQSEREDLDVNELYVQLMVKLRDQANGIGVGFGGGVKRMNIKDTVKASGYGWRYGEGGSDNINDQYDGWFWVVDFEKMLGGNASLYLRLRGDKAKTDDGLKLDSTSISGGINVYGF